VAWWWIVCSAGEIARSAVADDKDHEHMHGAVEAMTPHHPHTGPHMKWTTLRPVGAGDPEQANRIVQTLRQALSKYKDYHVAVDEGFLPMHPGRKPRHYHFANKERRHLARIQFDAAQPTSLLYKKTSDGYELEGAMFTAPRGMTEDELNERISVEHRAMACPREYLSRARWQWTSHQPQTVRLQGHHRRRIRMPASRRTVRCTSGRMDDPCLPLRGDR
jgi:hypothetical protein